MKQSKAILTLALLLLAALNDPLPAQEVGPTSTGLADKMTQVLGSGFRRLECEEFIYTPEGDINIVGQVDLKTDQLAIQCNSLSLDPETKIMTALGTPVKIQQGGVKAECKKFTYDIEKKQSILQQNPVVLEKSGGKTTRLSSDEIILSQDSKGNVGVHMKMNDRKPEKLTVIEVLPGGNDSETTKTAKAPPKKVNTEKERTLIKVPGVD